MPEIMNIVKKASEIFKIESDKVKEGLALYEKIHKKIKLGRYTEITVLCCLFSKIKDYPIFLNEFVEKTLPLLSVKVKKEMFRKIYWDVVKNTGEAFDRVGDPTFRKRIVDKIGQRLSFSPKAIQRTSIILERVVGHGIDSGKYPNSVIGACFYKAGLVSGERRTKEEVSEACSINKNSIKTSIF